MAGPKWTPGPWRISRHHSEGVGALSGRFVADCRVNADAALIPENEANAHLIAAAPELYAALREMVDVYREGCADDEEPTCIQAALAALTKAEAA